MNLLGCHQAGDLGCGVFEVTGDDRLLGTHHDTGRLESHLHPVHAVVALLGGVLVGIDVQRVVRAGLHARLAADAARCVEVDDPILTDEEGTGGADPDAGCIDAVVAPHHAEVAFGVRPRPLLDVLHPGAVHAKRHLVLGLAGNGAGVTPDARILIDDEAVARHQLFAGISNRLPLNALRSSRVSHPPHRAGGPVRTSRARSGIRPAPRTAP